MYLFLVVLQNKIGSRWTYLHITTRIFVNHICKY